MPAVLTILAGLFLFSAAWSAHAAPNAAAEEFWAYQKVSRPEPPPVGNRGWPRTPIDRFILARLEKRGLAPAPDASPAALLRRVHYDLTGLPPSAEEVERFQADPSRAAYEGIVERLLNSPHFGERWGRHWLDVARFAESVTLRGLVFEHAWRYRDYVIEAFNRDLPYDQFIREQIAGDLLEYETVEGRQRGRAATTFLTLGNINYEEQDKAQLRMDIVDEQLDTIGKAFLAQTFGCARCHDHKFDPIPARDYYAMAGILRNTKSVEHANVSKWVEVPLPLGPEAEARYAALEAAKTRLEAEVKEKKAALARLRGEGSTGPINPASLPGIVVDDSQAEAAGEWKHSTYSGKFVGAGYLHDLAEGKGSKTLAFLPKLKEPGEYEVRLAYVPSDNRAGNVPVTIRHAGGETVVRVDQRKIPPINERFVVLGRFAFEKENPARVIISTEGTTQHVIADAVQFIPAGLIEPAGGANAAETARAKEEAARVAAELKGMETELKRVRSKLARRPMVMSVLEEEEIADTFIHLRGSVHTLGERAPRGFLAVASGGWAPAVPSDESGRRELAEWIASPENPLTARVMANRVWHWLAGSGIVRTTDNFGKMGARPSHPKLLDYLAARFVEEGWSVKGLIREIVVSRVYQLSSEGSEELLAADPGNRLFGRANRRRLGPEAIRDTMLLLAGRLDFERGGPSINPGTKADYGYVDSDTRRSVYVPVLRNALPELFELFDFANPSMVTGQRNESTTAPQALFFLNDPFVLEQARAAASRLLRRKERSGERLRYLYLSALGRAPSNAERAIAESYLSQAAAHGGEQQAWSDICQAVFASIDFRYLE